MKKKRFGKFELAAIATTTAFLVGMQLVGNQAVFAPGSN
jgi:hypothetical protein